VNGNVDPASVEPADLRINGTGATGVSVADPHTLVFDLPPLSLRQPLWPRWPLARC